MGLHVNFENIIGPDQTPCKGTDQEVIDKVRRFMLALGYPYLSL